MDRPFSIRRARAEDVFDVHRIHTTAIRNGAGDHYHPEVVEVWVDAFNPESFPRNIQRVDFWVVDLSDGRTAAFLAFDLTTAEIDSIYVAPWGSGMGLGSFLLGFAEESARRAGLESVWLDSSLNAVTFFSGYEWKEAGKHARVRKGMEIPVMKMEKDLGS